MHEELAKEPSSSTERRRRSSGKAIDRIALVGGLSHRRATREICRTKGRIRESRNAGGLRVKELWLVGGLSHRRWRSVARQPKGQQRTHRRRKAPRHWHKTAATAAANRHAQHRMPNMGLQPMHPLQSCPLLQPVHPLCTHLLRRTPQTQREWHKPSLSNRPPLSSRTSRAENYDISPKCSTRPCNRASAARTAS